MAAFGKWRLIVTVFSIVFVDLSKGDGKYGFKLAVYMDKAFSNRFNGLSIQANEGCKLILNGLRYFLADSSLKPEVDFDIIIRNTSFTFPEFDISFDNYLNIFANLQEREKNESSIKWDHAVLLMGNASKPIGMTYPGSFCDPLKSVTAIRARDLHLSSLRLAQYLGLSLGMEWDPKETPGYIMSPKVGPKVYAWSKKSLNAWNGIFNSKKCLVQVPGSKGFIGYLPGLQADAETQCQVAHGINFRNVDLKNSVCEVLRCQNGTSAVKSLKVSSLSGTICDQKGAKYCWKGDCVKLVNILSDIIGESFNPTPSSIKSISIFRIILDKLFSFAKLIGFFFHKL